MGCVFSGQNAKARILDEVEEAIKAGQPVELDINKVLANANACDQFLKFAQADFSSENLEFWLEVPKFHAAYEKAGSDAERRKLADEMIAEFLTDTSNRFVCIGASNIAEVKSAELSKNMFDGARETALNTLNLDIFPRFTESPGGLELAKRSELCMLTKVKG